MRPSARAVFILITRLPGAHDAHRAYSALVWSIHLQVLAKFPQHRLTQKIGIEFTSFCKLNNPFGDSFIKNIASIAKLKSFASHFECDAHDPRGLGIEVGAAKKLRDGHDPQLSAMELVMQILRVKGMTDFGPASVRRCISARRMTIF